MRVVAVSYQKLSFSGNEFGQKVILYPTEFTNKKKSLKFIFILRFLKIY